jgi:hypothetical protein
VRVTAPATRRGHGPLVPSPSGQLRGRPLPLELAALPRACTFNALTHSSRPPAVRTIGAE